MIGAGSIGASSQGNYIQLSDNAGVSKGGFVDSDGVPVFEVDSLGNYGGTGAIIKPNR